MSLFSSRNWDGSAENDRDSRFHDLRDSGYRGPIDQDGNRIDDLDKWCDEQLHAADVTTRVRCD